MSCLDKLAIRGIRSFDHNDLSIMQFYSPLTVIVGHNGSGKTTIIECLKYATTGDMPPNTKGGAFVHDPSIAGVNEVKAIVKLRFYNVKKEKMMVERRVQVTRKKTGNGLTLKTLEGVLSYDDEDSSKSKKRSTLSTKCAALDEEVPRQLGVSRAILDNVIFCHQEESNWPLSEPAALKKKFDDIFEATKYTKALDQIRILRKEQAVEIKVNKEKMSALKTDRDRADKLKKAIEFLSNSIIVKEAEKEKLDADINQIILENKHFYNQATKYSEILNKADTLKTQKTLTEQNLESIRGSIVELPDSDNELAQKIQNHENDQKLTRTERETTKQHLHDEIDRQSNFEKMRSIVQTLHGRLQADKQRYTNNIAYRQTLIKELSIKHNIPGYDHDLTEEEMSEFDEKLTEGMNTLRNKISRMKSEARAKENELQTAIQGLKSVSAGEENAKKNKHAQLRAISTRINEINRKIDSFVTTAQDVAYKQSELDDEMKRRKELQMTYRERQFPQQTSTKNRDLKELEDQRESLHLELTSLNTQADVRAKLGLKRNELESKNKAIQTGLDKATLAFRRFKKADPLKENMESELTAVNDTLTGESRLAETALNQATRELQGIETSINLTKANYEKLQKDANVAKARITAGLNALDTEAADTVAGAIAEAEVELVEAVKDLSKQEGAGKIFTQLLASGKKEEVCMGCNRGLSKAELKDFEAYCKAQAQNAPEKLHNCQESVADWERQLQSLKRLLPVEASYFKLIKDDIPTVEKSLAALTEKLEPARTKAQEALSRSEEIKNKLIDLQQLRRTAGDITRLVRECSDVIADIERLTSELSASGSTATPDEIQQKITAISESIRTTKVTLEKLAKDSSLIQKQISDISESIHRAEMEITVKKQEMKERDSLEQRKESERAEVAKLEQEIKDLEAKIKEGSAPIRKLQEELEAVQTEFGQNESNASQKLQTYNKSFEQLEVNGREIQNYVSKGSRADLEKSEKDLKKNDAAIEETKKKVADLRTKLASIDKNLADSQGILRNFIDNQRIRKGVSEMKAIDRQIEELDAEGAKKAHRNFEEKYKEMRHKQSDMSMKQSKITGEVATIQVDLDSKNDEMKSEYEGVHDKYRTELIKVKTAEFANADLEKYAKALDRAIMDFHGHKMDEINATIADLWTKTYQGTDIDTIMLKADSESKTIAGRNYNYRVVMFKDKSEMDMRGRCSAGQKVLASIVIRLALAESFGANCGIMALDEPTTNLDKQNVDALAKALSELLELRRGQSNFQLIIITHDEEFLATIGASGSVSKYWRVSRANGTGASAGQVSTISREKLD